MAQQQQDFFANFNFAPSRVSCWRAPSSVASAGLRQPPTQIEMRVEDAPVAWYKLQGPGDSHSWEPMRVRRRPSGGHNSPLARTWLYVGEPGDEYYFGGPEAVGLEEPPTDRPSLRPYSIEEHAGPRREFVRDYLREAYEPRPGHSARLL